MELFHLIWQDRISLNVFLWKGQKFDNLILLTLTKSKLDEVFKKINVQILSKFYRHRSTVPRIFRKGYCDLCMLKIMDVVQNQILLTICLSRYLAIQIYHDNSKENQTENMTEFNGHLCGGYEWFVEVTWLELFSHNSLIMVAICRCATS